MHLKETVDEFLQTNFEQIENWRQTLPNFRWKLIADEVGEGLSSEYVRNRFRKIRNVRDENILDKDTPKKILFVDLESSYNLVSSWRIGNKVRLNHDNIIQERKIICISYSLENEEKVHTLYWNSEQCDAKMLLEFVKVLEKVDILCGHNSDSFDFKFIRTRCAYHGIPFPNKLKTIDTLKMARNSFYFNNNKLDYISKFLGVGEKVSTGGLPLWDAIILHKDKEALKTMISYCENDVRITKEVYKKLQKYVPIKKFRD